MTRPAAPRRATSHVAPPSSDVAFTPAVKEIQRRHGSRQVYERMEQGGGWETEITDELAAFITAQTSFFFATASKDGQPYIQHRGGPRGFLRVVDEHTLRFADYRGNRQYISVGNLTENTKVHLFLIDFEHRRRIKIWGNARVVEGDRALLSGDGDPDDGARVERAIVIEVTAWDVNCPQHIPQRFEAEDVRAALEARDREIADLRARLRRHEQNA